MARALPKPRSTCALKCRRLSGGEDPQFVDATHAEALFEQAGQQGVGLSVGRLLKKMTKKCLSWNWLRNLPSTSATPPAIRTVDGSGDSRDGYISKSLLTWWRVTSSIPIGASRLRQGEEHRSDR